MTAIERQREGALFEGGCGQWLEPISLGYVPQPGEQKTWSGPGGWLQSLSFVETGWPIPATPMFTPRVFAKHFNKTRLKVQTSSKTCLSPSNKTYSMPVAYNSRRKHSSRRQNSEDIEDVRNTQENGDIDDDVSDEDRPRTTKTVVKKEPRQTNGKQRADPEDDDDDGGHAEDEDEDDDDQIDVHNLPDQPLRKIDMHKLQGMSEDWVNMKRQINQNAGMYIEVAAAMAEAGEQDLKSSRVTFPHHTFPFFGILMRTPPGSTKVTQ